MASFFFNNFQTLVNQGTIDTDTDTLKIMLIGAAANYTPDNDTEVLDTGGAADILDDELTGVSGYTGGWGGAGRKTVSVTVTNDHANNRTQMVFGDLTWTALGAGDTITAACLVKEGGANDTTSAPLVWFDVADTATNGGDVTLDFAAAGNAFITTWHKEG